MTNFLSNCRQIRSFLRIWSYLLKNSLMEKFIFCAVFVNLAESPIYWLMLVKCLPIVLIKFKLQHRFWKPAKKWRNEEGISKKTLNLNSKNDLYVYYINCAYSEISICFFLIYHVESCILFVWKLFCSFTNRMEYFFLSDTNHWIFFQKIVLLKVH